MDINLVDVFVYLKHGIRPGALLITLLGGRVWGPILRAEFGGRVGGGGVLVTVHMHVV